MRSSSSAAKPRRNARRTSRAVLICAFLVILYLPGLGLLFQPHRQQAGGAWQESEYRPFPALAWQWSSILSFPRGFGDFFGVHFGFRRNLIRWHTTLVHLFGKHSTSNVLEGKDGWLFFGATNTVQDYRGLLTFTPQQLQRWQEVLQKRQDWLSAQGIHYLFVICPDKHSIYPEYMPDVVNRVGAQTRLDQLVQYLREHSTVPILDLRAALRELKTTHLCYQPQETHWNGMGAFAAYQEIVRSLQAWYPQLRALQWRECETFLQENPQTDLLRLLGRQDLTTQFETVRPRSGFAAAFTTDPNDRHGTVYNILHGTRRTAPIGRLLMFRDSFATLLIPFLGEHVREGLYIWDKGDRFCPQDVLDFRPDVVIEEILERKLCEIKPELLETSLPPLEDAPARK